MRINLVSLNLPFQNAVISLIELVGNNDIVITANEVDRTSELVIVSSPDLAEKALADGASHVVLDTICEEARFLFGKYGDRIIIPRPHDNGMIFAQRIMQTIKGKVELSC